MYNPTPASKLAGQAALRGVSGWKPLEPLKPIELQNAGFVQQNFMRAKPSNFALWTVEEQQAASKLAEAASADNGIEDAEIKSSSADASEHQDLADAPVSSLDAEAIEKAITQHLLLTHLPNQRLCYNSNGKPYLKDGGYISISHSNSLIGIAWSFDYNIGLDIEEVNDRIFRVENRFISEKEMTFAKSLLDKLTVWSLKEVLIKINDDKSLNLKTDLIIERANENQWRGWTSKKPQEIHDFITFEYCNNIVCINKASER